jgi:hypothetical protein
MDPELSRQAKDLLERYRKAESLGSDARARMLSGLRAKMSVGGPPVGATKASLKPALSKLASLGKAKLLLGLLAVAVPAAWTIHRSQRSVDYTLRTATPSVPAAPTVVAEATVAAAPSAMDGEPYGSASAIAAAVPFEALPEAEPAGEPKTRSRRASPNERAVTSGTKAGGAEAKAETSSKASAEGPSAAGASEANPTPESTLDQEMQLLKRARLAQKAGRPTEALAILAEHAKQFPNGKLSESRDVARVIALCDAGQVQASRAAAERFLAGRPNSPFANRVRTVCTDGEKGR